MPRALRRRPTPSPGAREQTGAGRLPEELLSEQVRRLAVFAAVGAGLWTYGLVMDTVIYPLILEAPIPWVNVVMAIVAIVTSVALFLYVPYKGHSPQTKSDAGLLYFVLNAMFVAVLNTWNAMPAIDSMHLSWNIVTILVSSMIMPATPRKMLTGQLVFDGDTPMKKFVQHVERQPIPPSQRTEMPIPRELDEIVLACLEKDPRRRPQNAEELLRMLRRCRAGGTWDNDAARGWWEKHLQDLTGPLTANDASPHTADRTLVVH